MLNCPNCGTGIPAPAPVEPAIGTWVKDRNGVASVRNSDGWAPAPTGFYGTGKWEEMWAAHGPLIECASYGVE